MKFAIKALTASVILACAGSAMAQKGETVKVAWIDPLSGLMAALGSNQLKSLQYAAEEINKNSASGVKFEIIGIDNKLSPQETTAALRSAMDQGVRYVFQGNGSGPALAIMDALEKHNARNKGKEVVFLNYAAVDPDLTNSKCSYWHFRLDADTSMKMEALTTYMKDVPEIKKVYLINQNYSHGQQVSKYAKEMLKKKRPDVEIVGDDFSPWPRCVTLPLCRQDQAVGCRYGDHGQLGFGPGAADQGRQRCRAEQRQVLYLLRHCHGRSHGPGRSGCGQGVYGGLRPSEHARHHGENRQGLQGQGQ